MPPFEGQGVPTQAHIVQCVVVTLARLGMQLAPSVLEVLGRYAMTPDIGVWTELSFLHLAEFAPLPLLPRRISTSRRAWC
jgi:hypothetical protein